MNTDADVAQAQMGVPEAFLDRVRSGQTPFDQAVPPSFLHRLALGMMIGEIGQSPAELRAKGFEDFDVAANTVNHFKAGLDRIKKGFSETHSSFDIGAGAIQSLLSPASAVFQAIGGAGEKASGGILTGEQINTALMLGDGAPGTFARVRNGAQEAIGGLPKAEDFSNGAKVLSGQTSDGMPSLFAKFGETGRAEKNSSIEAPPGAQSPLDQVSTRPEPSGSSTTRPTTPLSTSEGPATTFRDLELGAIDGSSNKKILQGSNDYKALLTAAETNKPKLADALQRVTEGIDGASVYGVRVKDEPGLIEKITTKGRAPSTISDYLGGRVVADTPEAMNQVLARFESTGAVIEAENFVHSPKAGYRAYHLQIGLGDGTSAEIQIVPRPIADKIDETHAIRQPFKRMAEASPEGMARFKEAMERAVKVSDDAWTASKGWPESKIRDLSNPVDTAQDNLRRMWQEDGIHPAEAVHDAQADAFLKNEITAKHVEVKPDLTNDEKELLGTPASLSAAATNAPLTSPQVQPLSAPGRLTAAARKTMDDITGLGKNIQYLLDPMATGSNTAMVIAKDAMNSVRRIRWDHARSDADLVKRFDDESLSRMWNAADEESVSRQLGEPEAMREHQGLATLTPEESATVDALHTRAQAAWLHAVDTGMVEGEGLPSYTPRMVANVALSSDSMGPKALNELGRNIFTRTSQMLHRSNLEAQETEAAAQSLVRSQMEKQGATPEQITAALEKVKLVRNIRTLPLATARLEEASVWKDMINKIEMVGKSAGSDTVSIGSKPDSSWFTIEGNPAFSQWRPKFEYKSGTENNPVVKDSNGNVVFERVPIYMHSDFKGPMRAILDESVDRGKVVGSAQSLYGALMALKGKAMTVILNSPLIHNQVVWGKVAEAAGGKEWMGFGLYSRGNKIVNGTAGRAQELIDRGLNPFGPRASLQDITGEAEGVNFEPGRSLTAKAAAFVPGLFDAGAEVAVKKAIDKAGDFTHNTLLWDRVRDVHFGLADLLSDKIVSGGVDRLMADRISTHFSNIIVGSIPKEAMSAGARATANLLLFSRSFTLGNLSTFKQAAMGLPKPILAQIERDFGMTMQQALAGTPEAAAQISDISQTAKSIARRKAISTIALSAGMYYVGNALVQHAFDAIVRDQGVNDIVKGYVRRFNDAVGAIKEDPFELRHLLARLSPTWDNEPWKQDRAYLGNASDGTGIYARNPSGKFGEEMTGYATKPMMMLRGKLSPMAGGLLDVLTNDDGIGRKLYNEHDSTIRGDIDTAMRVGKHLIMKHLPEGQITAAGDLLRGDGNKVVNTLRLVGPALGFTASVGAPGGPQRGEQLAAKQDYEARFSLAWPNIKKQIQRGDEVGASAAMKDIGVPAMAQRGLMRAAKDPAASLRGRTLLDFYQYATPEQKLRFEGKSTHPGIPDEVQP
jgi:ppGpp synthetase/RelA/SpoT-type nucleotidyltranferase